MSEHLNTETVCVTCGGNGQIRGFLKLTKSECEFGQVLCDRCQGTGTMTAEQVKWIVEGHRFQLARVKREEHLHEAAARLGVSVVYLSDMERGMHPVPKEWQA